MYDFVVFVIYEGLSRVRCLELFQFFIFGNLSYFGVIFFEKVCF